MCECTGQEHITECANGDQRTTFGGCSPFPSCESQRLNSGHQTLVAGAFTGCAISLAPEVMSVLALECWLLQVISLYLLHEDADLIPLYVKLLFCKTTKNYLNSTLIEKVVSNKKV